MTWQIILYICLMGIALSMDAFAVSITDGLIYKDLNNKKSLIIAIVFGFMQALMPLIGFWIIEAIQSIISSLTNSNALEQGKLAGEIMSNVVCYISFILLEFVGIKMLIEAIKDLKKSKDEKKEKCFSLKEVLLFGLLTSIDALATGVALHATEIDKNGNIIYTLSNQATIFIHVSIIMVITFIISFVGVKFGHFFEKKLKGKYEIASIIGGSILIVLGLWILLSHIFHIGF